MKTLARRSDAAEVLHRISALRPDSGARWGRMSAHQMVCHLSDGYRILTGERSAQPIAPPLPLPRVVIKWIALYAPLEWPKDITTTPELDQAIGGTKPMDFTRDVADLANLIEWVAGPVGASLDHRRHPIFGPMSAAAWRRWAYLHADHHLRQFGV